MAGKRRKHPKVRIRWDRRRIDDDGLAYATLRWMRDGTRHQQALGHLTPEDAEDAARIKEAELLLGIEPETATARPCDVADLLIAYGKDVEARCGEDSKHAMLEVRRGQHLADGIGHIRADRLSTADLRAYMNHRSRQKGEKSKKPVKRSTIVGELASLRRAYKLGYQRGMIEVDCPELPAKKTLPDDARPPRRLTEDEVRALINAAHEDPRDGFGELVQVLAWSGRRPVAIFALRVKDLERLDDGKAYFEKDKGGESRGWGPLTAPAKAALKVRLEARRDAGPDAHLWVRDNGKPYCSVSVRQPFHRSRKRAKLKNVKPYDLRKFAATRIYRATGSIPVTMQFTGHQQPATLLNHYVYAERDAAENIADRIGWTPATLRAVKQES